MLYAFSYKLALHVNSLTMTESSYKSCDSPSCLDGTKREWVFFYAMHIMQLDPTSAGSSSNYQVSIPLLHARSYPSSPQRAALPYQLQLSAKLQHLRITARTAFYVECLLQWWEEQELRELTATMGLQNFQRHRSNRFIMFSVQKPWSSDQ